MEKNDIIKELVSDSILKIKSKSENNEKLLGEMHNTLNWLLTLTTLLFLFYSRQEFDKTTCLMQSIDFLSKIDFVLIITAFLFYKIIQFQFLKMQTFFYDSLVTHNLELKYNLDKLKKEYDFSDLNNPPFIFEVVKFINYFRKAKFVFYKELDDRPVVFEKAEKKLNILSWILKNTFRVIFVLFSLYALGAIVILFS